VGVVCASFLIGLTGRNFSAEQRQP
jgi:hypothetical protein